MKGKNLFLLPVLAVLLLLTCPGVNGQEKTGSPANYDQIADKIVNFVLQVQPGEVVLLEGTPDEMDLLGSLYLAVNKAGGHPSIEISIPKINKRVIMETPIEFLKDPSDFWMMRIRAADCYISTGSDQDPKLWADVPEERMEIIRQLNTNINRAFVRAKIRYVGIGQSGGIPTKAYAEFTGANYEEMRAMFWKAIDVDYAALLAKGKSLAAKYKPGSQIKLTSDAGTDISFRIDNIPARTNCGRTSENISAFTTSMIWLPAGEVYACVDPKSANGKIVVPFVNFRGNPVKNLKMTFANGRLTGITADANAELIQESMKRSTGDKDVLSTIDIGINPNSHPLKDATHNSYEMAGMVTLTMGNNTVYGGNVNSDFALDFFLPNTTMSINNEVAVSQGVLK